MVCITIRRSQATSTIAQPGPVLAGLTQHGGDRGELLIGRLRDYFDVLAESGTSRLGKDGADGEGDHLGVSFADFRQRVAHELDAAAPRRLRSDRSWSGLWLGVALIVNRSRQDVDASLSSRQIVETVSEGIQRFSRRSS
jgi:hypothetical protein